MEEKLIKTTKGMVKGSTKEGVDIYLGIPFGKKPVGEYRFLPPVEPDVWDGVLDATKWPHNPMQPASNKKKLLNKMPYSEMSEDCLYLNVFVPHGGATNKAVMVWFYGGGYTAGGCSYDLYNGYNLAKNNDVIVVTGNYRVGIFGFLYNAEINKGNKTNAGVGDAIAILKWVQDNIEAFGGNKNNVTVFGQSAGSSLINLLMVSPPAKGLFHAAITQSGSPFNHDEWNIDKDRTEKKCWQYLNKIGIHTTEELLNATPEQLLSDKDAYAIAEFCPYIDGYYLPEDLETLFMNRDIIKVPVMVGLTKDEASVLVNGGDAHGERGNATAASFERTVVRKYDFKEARDFIYEYYGPYLKYDPAYALSRFRSDNSLANQTYFAEHLNRRTEQDIYVYEFDHVPASNNPAYFGAYHGCEVAYVFNNLNNNDGMQDYYDIDKKVSLEIGKYWTNFAKNHDPNSDDLPVWRKHTESDTNIMHLDYPSYCAKLENNYKVSMFKKILVEKIYININH